MRQDPFFEREDKKYFEEWMERAKQGSATAIYMVAECFYTGKGTYKNIDEAARWYKLAADGENLAAEARLNEMFAKGEISEKYVPNHYVPPKKKSSSFFGTKKKKSARKKIYDGSFASSLDEDVVAGIFNDHEDDDDDGLAFFEYKDSRYDK